ncbi:MAG TPA: Calx-beta domain-containing protein [Mycobacteriales bacterium]|nr:Calx-beta domain-containing protein [Mycobacteriales bacterium]
MSPSLPRALSRTGVVLAGVVAVGLLGAPAAHAVNPSAHLTLAPGQVGSIGRVVSNTDITPVPTCDTYLSVSYDATMNGTVAVAADATVGSYSCTVDFQLAGQSTGLLQDVFVDVVPGLSVSDVSGQEGSSGLLHTESSGPRTDSSGGPLTTTHVALFVVTMSVPSTTAVTVAVATANGTATAPSDYTAVSTTVTFQPGQTATLVPVTITPDDTEEADETFSVTLSAPTAAVIVDAQGTGTILNDDHTLTT